ncbi:MAG: winged helix-turn-helix domain-containing protein [Blastocatellia bacterium]|nr:winged helix-turn-helix domain-containing protein [Blastocatellia bacterium]
MAEKYTSTQWKEWRRQQAFELRHKGWTYQQISEALGVTKGAISQWMKQAEAKGGAGLEARPHSGSPARLSAAQQEMLPEYLSHGAEAYGFRGEVWTSRRVALVIKVEFGVQYHPATVTRLLKKLKWTPQKPIEQASQRDETKIARWREETWPKLKKKPCGKTEP